MSHPAKYLDGREAPKQALVHKPTPSVSARSEHTQRIYLCVGNTTCSTQCSRVIVPLPLSHKAAISLALDLFDVHFSNWRGHSNNEDIVLTHRTKGDREMGRDSWSYLVPQFWRQTVRDGDDVGIKIDRMSIEKVPVVFSRRASKFIERLPDTYDDARLLAYERFKRTLPSNTRPENLKLRIRAKMNSEEPEDLICRRTQWRRTMLMLVVNGISFEVRVLD